MNRVPQRARHARRSWVTSHSGKEAEEGPARPFLDKAIATKRESLSLIPENSQSRRKILAP